MTESAVLTESAQEIAEAKAHEVRAPEAHFDRDDLVEFTEDDTEAASNIGKMLTAFFFYSLLAMAFVSWWAYTATR
jgi:hypothetical protein